MLFNYNLMLFLLSMHILYMNERLYNYNNSTCMKINKELFYDLLNSYEIII